MLERVRVAAIIIKDKKLLLVHGPSKYKEYWTPGGKLEKGETEIACLERELKEELSVRLVLATFFGEYIAPSFYEPNILSKNRVYIAEIEGKIKPGKEITRFAWVSLNDIESGKYSLIPLTKDQIIVDLVRKGYL